MKGLQAPIQFLPPLFYYLSQYVAALSWLIMSGGLESMQGSLWLNNYMEGY